MNNIENNFVCANCKAMEEDGPFLPEQGRGFCWIHHIRIGDTFTSYCKAWDAYDYDREFINRIKE